MFYKNKFHVSKKSNFKRKFAGISKGNKKIRERERQKMQKKVPVAKSPQQTGILLDTCYRKTCLHGEFFKCIKQKF